MRGLEISVVSRGRHVECGKRKTSCIFSVVVFCADSDGLYIACAVGHTLGGGCDVVLIEVSK